MITKQDKTPTKSNEEKEIMRLLEEAYPGIWAQLRARAHFIAAFERFIERFGQFCNLPQQTSHEICAAIITKKSDLWLKFIIYLSYEEQSWAKRLQRKTISRIDLILSTLGLLVTILPIIGALLYCVREIVGANTPLSHEVVDVVCAVVGVLGACLGRFVGVNLTRCMYALGKRCNSLVSTVYHACLPIQRTGPEEDTDDDQDDELELGLKSSDQQSSSQSNCTKNALEDPSKKQSAIEDLPAEPEAPIADKESGRAPAEKDAKEVDEAE
jgi:hypothetical protein